MGRPAPRLPWARRPLFAPLLWLLLAMARCAPLSSGTPTAPKLPDSCDLLSAPSPPVFACAHLRITCINRRASSLHCRFASNETEAVAVEFLPALSALFGLSDHELFLRPVSASKLPLSFCRPHVIEFIVDASVSEARLEVHQFDSLDNTSIDLPLLPELPLARVALSVSREAIDLHLTDERGESHVLPLLFTMPPCFLRVIFSRACRQSVLFSGRTRFLFALYSTPLPILESFLPSRGGQTPSKRSSLRIPATDETPKWRPLAWASSLPTTSSQRPGAMPTLRASYVMRNQLFLFFENTVYLEGQSMGTVDCSSLFTPVTILALGAQSLCVLMGAMLFVQAKRSVPNTLLLTFLPDHLTSNPSAVTGLRGETGLALISSLLVSSSAELDHEFHSILLTFTSPLQRFRKLRCSEVLMNDNLGSKSECVLEPVPEHPNQVRVILGSGATITPADLSAACSMDSAIDFSSFLFFSGRGLIQEGTKMGAFGCISVTYTPLNDPFVLPLVLGSRRYSSLCDLHVALYGGESQIHSMRGFSCSWSSPSELILSEKLVQVKSCLLNMSLSHFLGAREHEIRFTLNSSLQLMPVFVDLTLTFDESPVAHVRFNIPLNHSFFFDQAVTIHPEVSFGLCRPPEGYTLQWTSTCGVSLSKYLQSNGSLVIPARTFVNTAQEMCLSLDVLTPMSLLGHGEVHLRQQVQPIHADLPTHILMGSNQSIRLNSIHLSYEDSTMTYFWQCREESSGKIANGFPQMGRKLDIQHNTLLPNRVYLLTFTMNAQGFSFEHEITVEVGPSNQPLFYLLPRTIDWCQREVRYEVILSSKTTPHLVHPLIWRVPQCATDSMRWESESSVVFYPSMACPGFGVDLTLPNGDVMHLEESVAVPAYIEGYFHVYPSRGVAFETLFTIEYRGFLRQHLVSHLGQYDDLNTYQFGYVLGDTLIPLAPAGPMSYLITTLPVGTAGSNHCVELYVDIWTSERLHFHFSSPARQPGLVSVRAVSHERTTSVDAYFDRLMTTVLTDQYKGDRAMAPALLPSALDALSDPCLWTPCQNGECSDGVCVCSEGFRGRLCEVPLPVDGGWSEWVSLPCMHDAGDANATVSMRRCSNPEPAHNGRPCEGSSLLIDVCRLPVPHSRDVAKPSGSEEEERERLFGPWSGWSRCSATCKGSGSFFWGSEFRFRPCMTMHNALCLRDPVQVETRLCHLECSPLQTRPSQRSLQMSRPPLSDLYPGIGTSLNRLVEFLFPENCTSSFELLSSSVDYLSGLFGLLSSRVLNTLLQCIDHSLRSVPSDSPLSISSYRTFLMSMMEISVDRQNASSPPRAQNFLNPDRESVEVSDIVEVAVRQASNSLHSDTLSLSSRLFDIEMVELWLTALPDAISWGMTRIEGLPMDPGWIAPTEPVVIGIGTWKSTAPYLPIMRSPLFFTRLFHKSKPLPISLSRPLVLSITIPVSDYDTNVTCYRLAGSSSDAIEENDEGGDSDVIRPKTLWMKPVVTMSATRTTDRHITLMCLSDSQGRFLLSSLDLSPQIAARRRVAQADLSLLMPNDGMVATLVFMLAYLAVLALVVWLGYRKDRRIAARLEEKQRLVYVLNGSLSYSYQESSMWKTFKNLMLYQHSVLSLMSRELHPYLTYSCWERAVVLLCMSVTGLGMLTEFMNSWSTLSFWSVAALVITSVFMSLMSYSLPHLFRFMHNIRASNSDSGNHVAFSRSLRLLGRYRVAYRLFGLALICASVYPVLPILQMFGSSLFSLVMFCGYALGILIGLLVFFSRLSRRPSQYLCMASVILIPLAGVISGLFFVVDFNNRSRFYYKMAFDNSVLRSALDSVERMYQCIGYDNYTDMAVNDYHSPLFAMMETLPPCSLRVSPMRITLLVTLLLYLLAVAVIYLGLLILALSITRLLRKTQVKPLYSEPRLVHAARMIQRWCRRIGVTHNLRNKEFDLWLGQKHRLRQLSCLAISPCVLYFVCFLSLSIERSVEFSLPQFFTVLGYFIADLALSLFVWEVSNTFLSSLLR